MSKIMRRYSCKASRTVSIFLLIGSFLLSAIQSTTVDLNVGAYFEVNTTNRGWNSAGVWPAVQLAAEHVNQRNDVLPGYRLRLHVKDSRVRNPIFYQKSLSYCSAVVKLLKEGAQTHTVVERKNLTPFLFSGPSCLKSG